MRPDPGAPLPKILSIDADLLRTARVSFFGCFLAFLCFFGLSTDKILFATSLFSPPSTYCRLFSTGSGALLLLNMMLNGLTYSLLKRHLLNCWGIERQLLKDVKVSETLRLSGAPFLLGAHFLGVPKQNIGFLLFSLEDSGYAHRPGLLLLPQAARSNSCTKVLNSVLIPTTY